MPMFDGRCFKNDVNNNLVWDETKDIFDLNDNFITATAFHKTEPMDNLIYIKFNQNQK